MLIFGHLGVGSLLVRPWSRHLPKKWIYVGTLLPDLIDKPLFWIWSFLHPNEDVALSLISGTRTFGHTAVRLFLLSGVAFFRRSPALASLALGAASHLLLDSVADQLLGTRSIEYSLLPALLFPFMGFRFPVKPDYHSVSDYLAGSSHPFLIGAEIVGALILGWTYWKARHRREILDEYQESDPFQRRLRGMKKLRRAFGSGGASRRSKADR